MYQNTNEFIKILVPPFNNIVGILRNRNDGTQGCHAISLSLMSDMQKGLLKRQYHINDNKDVEYDLELIDVLNGNVFYELSLKKGIDYEILSTEDKLLMKESNKFTPKTSSNCRLNQMHQKIDLDNTIKKIYSDVELMSFRTMSNYLNSDFKNINSYIQNYVKLLKEKSIICHDCVLIFDNSNNENYEQYVSYLREKAVELRDALLSDIHGSYREKCLNTIFNNRSLKLHATLLMNKGEVKAKAYCHPKDTYNTELGEKIVLYRYAYKTIKEDIKFYEAQIKNQIDITWEIKNNPCIVQNHLKDLKSLIIQQRMRELAKIRIASELKLTIYSTKK